MPIKLDIANQGGRLALVTGTGGLGLHVAQELGRAGAQVIIAGRDAGKGEEALRSIRHFAPHASPEFEHVDLADLRSVANLADRLRDVPALDILVNNAGIMSPPVRKTTVQGFELQFGVNYLGHFALTGHLLPLLRRSASPRVVNVTSLAHRYGKLDFTDLQRERNYRPGEAYCQSKLAQALFARELQRRSDEGGWGLTSVAAHPGFASTNLFNNQGGNSLLSFVSTRIVAPLIGQSARDGSTPITFAATMPEVTPGGLYGPTGRFEMRGRPGPVVYAEAALDEVVAKRLWETSEVLTDVRFAQ